VSVAGENGNGPGSAASGVSGAASGWLGEGSRSAGGTAGAGRVVVTVSSGSIGANSVLVGSGSSG